MKRLVIPDLLDSDAGTPAEIAASLSDLRRINQWFGGISTTESMLVNVAQQLGTTSLSILEVGAGRGDGSRAVHRNLRQRGIELEITLLDRAFSHLTSGSRNGTPAVVGDAALPAHRPAHLTVLTSGICLKCPFTARHFERAWMRPSGARSILIVRPPSPGTARGQLSRSTR